MSQPDESTPTGVTEDEVNAAMGVSSVPDEVRVTSTDPDETGLVVDGGGELRPPAEDRTDGVAEH